MKTAFYAGSFDPFTNGHLDIVKKASELFDKVVIVIAINTKKSRAYNDDKMCAAIETTLKEHGITNCTVGKYNGLIADLMSGWNVKYLIRGLRDVVDYNYEENIAKTNKLIYPEIETVYFRADNNISSTMVKELYNFGKDVSDYVPTAVFDLMEEHE